MRHVKKMQGILDWVLQEKNDISRKNGETWIKFEIYLRVLYRC